MQRCWKRWQWKVRRALAVWLVERLYGEDMLWDDDDPEECVYSMQDWACDRLLSSETAKVTFQRALQLPSRTFLVTPATPGDDYTQFNFDRIK